MPPLWLAKVVSSGSRILGIVFILQCNCLELCFGKESKLELFP